MKIYAMTASFGKLEGETLRLEPGLNVFTAPNEWGKSTWCAFLLAMFYGLDTRAKSTKNSLAPKDHYAPWSGKPMSGRIDLNWKGRDITLERGTRGRVPLGEFRAYETASGLTVPELTAQNCGKEILGVEREIFCRTGFIRQGDLPDFQSELLRSRLTDLVTTGDDSGDAKVLADSLKDLKNRCKRLIPQAQAQLTQLEDGLERLTVLEDRCARLENQAQEAEIRQRQLENHLSALENRQVSQARKDWERACREKAYWEERCADLPTKEEAHKRLNDLRDYSAAWEAAARNQGNLEPEPLAPECLPAFAGLDPKQAQTKAENDAAAYRDSVGKESLIFLLLGLLALVLGAIAGISLLVGGIGIMNIMLVTVTERTREIGIRKAIGAERKSIITQFLIEAAVICSIGGLIGIGIGCVGTLVAGKLLLNEAAMLPSPFITMGAFLFSVVLGVIFGMYLAIKASGLQPVVALREE